MPKNSDWGRGMPCVVRALPVVPAIFLAGCYLPFPQVVPPPEFEARHAAQIELQMQVYLENWKRQSPVAGLSHPILVASSDLCGSDIALLLTLTDRPYWKENTDPCGQALAKYEVTANEYLARKSAADSLTSTDFASITRFSNDRDDTGSEHVSGSFG